MLPEVVTAIIADLELRRETAESRHAGASHVDQGYYAGLCAAYTLALALLRHGPGKDARS